MTPRAVPSLDYGPNSPFTGEKRKTVARIVDAVARSEHRNATQVLETIVNDFERLEAFGDLLAQFPSPLEMHHLGERERSLQSLSATLCRSNPANFEFRAPSRAIVGRALDMAEMNFYRLLRHACTEVVGRPRATRLRSEAADRLRELVYVKIVEEVLTDIVSDESVEKDVRERAVHCLTRIWHSRLSYRIRQFFPLLEATWEARRRIEVVGGTLLGTEEMFALFREGCDPDFVGYFVRPDPGDEEIAAFREFLFGKMTEELDALTAKMKAGGNSSVALDHRKRFAQDEGTLFYEFFRARFLKASARRMAEHAGPKRTAEGYVLLDFLSRGGPHESDE